MPTAWKIDLFPAQSEFHECEMQRATLEPVTIDGETVVCPVSTPEDVLLAKMRWYQDGGQVSDRQWGDIAGIVATNPIWISNTRASGPDDCGSPICWIAPSRNDAAD